LTVTTTESTLHESHHLFVRNETTAGALCKEWKGCVVVMWHVGYPAPELRWYHIYQGQKGLTPVIDDDKHFIHQLLSHGQVLSMVEIWYQMTIINVQANDYGVYICEGTNRLGTDQERIIIYGLYDLCCCSSTHGEIQCVPIKTSASIF